MIEERTPSDTLPTVGRVVWFYESSSDTRSCENHLIPYRADVIYVYEDGACRLHVTDHHGRNFVADDIVIFDPLPDESAPEVYDCHGSGQDYATWMPYQKKQHDKQKD